MTTVGSSNSTRGSGRVTSRTPSARRLLVAGIVLVAGFVGILLLAWLVVDRATVDKDYREAMEAIAGRDWAKAAELLEETLKSRPNNVQARIHLAKAYMGMVDPKKALDEINKALKQDPRNAVAFGLRGILRKQMKRHDEALADFSEAVRLNPQYAWAHAQIADLFIRTQNLEKALESVNKALDAKSDFVEALRMRALILTRIGQCRKAFEDFEVIEKLRPDDPWYLQDKAWYLLTCPDESVQDTNKAMKLALKAHDLSKGQDALTLETLAEAHFKQGDPLKASEHQKKAIELRKNNCPDGSCLGEMQQRLRKYELAARHETRPEADILPTDPEYGS